MKEKKDEHMLFSVLQHIPTYLGIKEKKHWMYELICLNSKRTVL